MFSLSQTSGRRGVPYCPIRGQAIQEGRRQGEDEEDSTTALRDLQPPTHRSQGQHSSGAHLFPGQTEALSEGFSNPAQQGLQSRKRKEMEEETKGGGASEIEMDELESIMSEDMDESDEPMSASQGQRLKLTEQSSTNQGQRSQLTDKSSTNKQLLETVELTSASKKQRVYPVEPIAANHRSGLESEERSSASRRQRAEPVAEVKGEEVSFIEVRGAVIVCLLSCVSIRAGVNSNRSHLIQEVILI